MMLASWPASRSLPLWITGTGVQPGCRDSENFPVDSLQPGLGDPRTFNVWSCEETSKGPWSPSFPGGPSVLPDTRPAPSFPCHLHLTTLIWLPALVCGTLRPLPHTPCSQGLRVPLPPWAPILQVLAQPRAPPPRPPPRHVPQGPCDDL